MDKGQDLDIRKLRKEILVEDPNNGGLAKGAAVTELSLDQLTGLLPRVLWEAEMAQFYKYAVRQCKNIAIAMMDIDKFRDYNNVYGHQAGDKKLQEFGQSIQRRFRNADIKGRYGGDEMIVMFTDFCLEGHELEEEEKILAEDLSKQCGLGISLGIAKWDGNESLEVLIERADMRLYVVKKSKKNE